MTSIVVIDSVAQFQYVVGPPGSQSPPLVFGPAMVGSQETGTNGTWANGPTSFAYQWKSAGVNAAGMGATTASYDPVTADIGNTLTLTVTATNAFGSSSQTSLPTPAVVAAIVPPVNNAVPMIMGTDQVGQNLKASKGFWSGNPTSYTYQWYQNVPVVGGVLDFSKPANSSLLAALLRAAMVI